MLKRWAGFAFNWMRGHRNLTLSLILHLCLVIFLIIGISSTVRQLELPANVNIVNASVIQVKPASKAVQRVKAKPKPDTVAINLKPKKVKKKKKKRKKVKKKVVKKKKVDQKKLKAQKQRLKKLRQQALASIKNTLKTNQMAARASAMRLTQKEKYIALLAQVIRSHWNNHLQDEDFQVSLKIVQDKTGDVVSVNVVKSSGSDVFDRSAEMAVRKASPLPQPADVSLQAQTRILTLAFSAA